MRCSVPRYGCLSESASFCASTITSRAPVVEAGDEELPVATAPMAAACFQPPRIHGCGPGAPAGGPSTIWWTR